jgi:rhodanese-related sulfurtransferase
VIVFDSRPSMEYAISLVPGALRVAPKPGVPISQYVSDVAEIGRSIPDPSTAIVLYCNGPFCRKSTRLDEELRATGFTNRPDASLALRWHRSAPPGLYPEANPTAISPHPRHRTRNGGTRISNIPEKTAAPDT